MSWRYLEGSYKLKTSRAMLSAFNIDSIAFPDTFALLKGIIEACSCIITHTPLH